MQDEEWKYHNPIARETIEELQLNAGGLVGAVASIEGTGRFVTGTRNDESVVGLNGETNPASTLGDRLALHSVRDAQGEVLGLGSRGGEESEEQEAAGGGWEAVEEAWTAHEGAVTGIDTAGSFGDLGGVSGIVTSGGDGCLRLFELSIGGETMNDGSLAPGPSFVLRGQVAAHADRATGISATRRRCVTVGQDGTACLVDLHRLEETGGGRSGGVVWEGRAKGGLPLSGVTFQGESEEIFATVGCDPNGQLMVWDSRKDNRPAHTLSGDRFSFNFNDHPPYLSVASQPFNPEVFACGISTGKVFVIDVRATGLDRVVHEMGPPKQAAFGGGTWGVTFHPRRPRHLLACTGTGMLMRWFMPPLTTASTSRTCSVGYGDGSTGASGLSGHAAEDLGPDAGDDSEWRGVRKLHELKSRSALVGVCYDEGADTVSAVSRLGHLVIAHGVKGLRL